MNPIAIIEATAATRRAVSGARPCDPVRPALPSRPVSSLRPKRTGLAFLRLVGATR